jgi:hypothetical protein
MDKEEYIVKYGIESYERKLAQHRKWLERNPKYMANFRKLNKNTLLRQQRRYKKEHKEEIAIQRKGYIKNHKKELADYQRRYRETSDGKAAHIRGQVKRERNLGFIPLNTYFNDCEGHHITHSVVIYIPKGLHKSVWHNLNTYQNMEVINALALDFLVNGF